MVLNFDNENDVIVKIENITKQFGGVYAVNDVSFKLYRREVLALVGDNGAGKSTLVKILSGAFVADRGRIYVNGKQVKIKNPMDARELGIEMIYQQLALMNNLDIPSNIFMGREIRQNWILGSLGAMNLRAMRRKTEDLLNGFKISIGDISKEVRNLSGGQRQLVAICRAVYFQAQIIIMDEPTAALGVAEAKKVYHFINKLKKVGVSVIIISHNINEVYEVADRVMVLKTGKLVDVVRKGDATIDNIITMIISGKAL